MNTYRLRPGYGSNELFIEITSGAENEIFLFELEKVLSPIKVEILGLKDLWNNDEMFFKATCTLGTFEISIDDINYHAYIMVNENQNLIMEIDTILNKSSLFEKEIVDFKKYEL